jgi:hypothetical protein
VGLAEQNPARRSKRVLAPERASSHVPIGVASIPAD